MLRTVPGVHCVPSSVLPPLLNGPAPSVRGSAEAPFRSPQPPAPAPDTHSCHNPNPETWPRGSWGSRPQGLRDVSAPRSRLLRVLRARGSRPGVRGPEQRDPRTLVTPSETSPHTHTHTPLPSSLENRTMPSRWANLREETGCLGGSPGPASPQPTDKAVLFPQPGMGTQGSQLLGSPCLASLFPSPPPQTQGAPQQALSAGAPQRLDGAGSWRWKEREIGGCSEEPLIPGPGHSSPNRCFQSITWHTKGKSSRGLGRGRGDA